MFFLDSFLLFLAGIVFLVGILIFSVSVVFFEQDHMFLLFFGYGFLLASLTLFVCSYLLFANIFIKF